MEFAIEEPKTSPKACVEEDNYSKGSPNMRAGVRRLVLGCSVLGMLTFGFVGGSLRVEPRVLDGGLEYVPPMLGIFH